MGGVSDERLPPAAPIRNVPTAITKRDRDLATTAPIGAAEETDTTRPYGTLEQVLARIVRALEEQPWSVRLTIDRGTDGRWSVVAGPSRGYGVTILEAAEHCLDGLVEDGLA